jgi:FkbM family methyltransferase
MGVLTELYRRFVLFRHKPRRWLLRPNTIDRRVFRSVAIDNEYELPPRFAPHDVILDVGGHVGSFSYAVLKRGAGVVYACEPDADNFRLLRHNLRPYRDRVHLFPHAVWRSDQAVARLYFHNHQGDPRNTGAGSVAGGPTARQVSVLPFDDLVDRATEGGARRVRLLKLDCEGAEWPILLTSRSLHRIDAVCGEYHLRALAGPYAVAGCPEFTPAVLERHLAQQGFRARTRPAPKAPHVGLFFAERGEAQARAA